MGEGASFALGPRRPLLHGCMGLSPLGTTEAAVAWAGGPPSLWDHRGPRRMGEGASFTWGPRRPPLHQRGASFALGPARPSPYG